MAKFDDLSNELLLMVFHNLDCIDLPMIQAVSKRFQALITGDPSLSANLFIRTTNRKLKFSRRTYTVHAQYYIDAYLDDRDPENVRRFWEVIPSGYWLGDTSCSFPATGTFHPVVEDLTRYIQRTVCSSFDRQSSSGRRGPLAFHTIDELVHKVNKDEPKHQYYGDTFVCMPPTQLLKLRFNFCVGHDINEWWNWPAGQEHSFDLELSNKAGVRLSEFIEKFQMMFCTLPPLLRTRLRRPGWLPHKLSERHVCQ